jgi:hypothetical protein
VDDSCDDTLPQPLGRAGTRAHRARALTARPTARARSCSLARRGRRQAFLHPHAFVDAIAATLPAGFAAPLGIIR